MKVAFLITKLDYSGGPKMLAWVTNQFVDKHNEVHLISIYSDTINQPLKDEVIVHKLNLKQSTSRIYRNTIEPLSDVTKIRKEMKKINPDLIISFLYSIDMYYMLFDKALCHSKCKYIVSMRMDPYSERRIADRVRHKISMLADGYIFQSNGARNYFPRLVQERGTVICNPVTQKTLNHCADVKGFAFRKDEIVVPARLNIPQKRQDMVILASKIVLKTHPEVTFTLLGDGPDKDRLQEMIAQERLENNVHIHEAVPSAEEYVKNCKIMLLASDYEGVPNALIEAMALGVNVVSTDCSPGGARMLIDDGVNGFLVNRGDYSELAKKICMLLDSAEMADELSNNGTEIRNKYSEINISKQWKQYAKKVCTQ